MLRVSVAPPIRALAQLCVFGLGFALSACESSSDPANATATLENEPGPQTEQIEVIQIGQPTGKDVESTAPDRGLEGTWTGQFRCGQGAINLDILVTRSRSSDLNAVVNFKPTEHSTDNVKGGQWTAAVSFSKNSRYATFQPEEWIDQPSSSHQMLTFKGRLDEPEMFLTGDVIGGAGCSKFRMSRIGAHPYTGQKPATSQEPIESQFDVNRISGNWTGSFSCSGNKLDLSLQIGADNTGNTLADIRFQDPDAPLKSEDSRGHWTAKVEPQGSGDIIDFEPIEWVEKPNSQDQMLLFRGSLSSNQNRIILNVENPNSSCTQITLKRPTHRR